MSKLTKKQKAFEGKVDSNKLYALTEAIALYLATGWYEIAPYITFTATQWFAKQFQA